MWRKKPIGLSVLSLQQQKLLFELEQPLFNRAEVKLIFSQVNEYAKTHAPPFTMIKRPGQPYHILFDGKQCYAISGIKLGQGGQGVVYAAAAMQADGKCEWVALKEGAGNKELYDMVIKFVYDKTQLLGEYREVMIDMEYQGERLAMSASDEEILKHFEMIMSDQINVVMQGLKDQAYHLDMLQGVKSSVFASGLLAYQVMPLIRGRDLITLSGAKDKDKTLIFDSIIADANADSELAVEKWNLFVGKLISVVKDIVLDVQHVHDKGYLHRDIKLDNFMLNTQGNIEMIDFGTVVPLVAGKFTGSVVGTQAYMPPELIQHQQINSEQNYTYSTADDIYSLGITLQKLGVKELLQATSALYSEASHPCIHEQAQAVLSLSNDLMSENRELRVVAMAELIQRLDTLDKLIKIENGLVLNSDARIDKTIVDIESYQALLKSISGESLVNRSILIVNGIEIPFAVAHVLLTSDLSAQSIAGNLHKIKFMHLQGVANPAEYLAEISKSSVINVKPIPPNTIEESVQKSRNTFKK